MALLAALVALCCIASTTASRSFKAETIVQSAEVSSSSLDFVRNVSGRATRSEVDQPVSRNEKDSDIFYAALRSFNGTSRRRSLGSLSSNPIDECWRGDANWAENRMKLVECSVGFGSNAVGGKNGKFYVVTDPGDDQQEPAPGTLRYGVIQLVPLWIIFKESMTITLKNELIMTSDKTIDGRGAKVEIAYGPCLTIQGVDNVIVHGINIHDCKPGKPGTVRSSTAHIGYREGSDGDGITVFGSTNVWIDHNSLSHCYDGLLDVIHGSTAITISNNVFTNHDKVMLLGHDDGFSQDKGMKVTVAYNRFGPGCVQRMPRCRLGYFHIVNNEYLSWGMYAIGGSANPTIISQGNRYQAPNNPDSKEVTKRDCSCGTGEWSDWTWKSMGDLLLNGAFFVSSGSGQEKAVYGLSTATTYVPSLTADAGVLSCSAGRPC